MAKKKAAKKSAHKPVEKSAAVSAWKQQPLQEAYAWYQAHQRVVHTALVCLLILIPLLMAVTFRSYSADLDATERWARQNIERNIKQQLEQQVQQQYPNLPEQNRQRLVNEDFEEVMAERGDELEQEVRRTSEYFKTRLQTDDGQTYLIAIDPYHWLRLTEDYIERGHVGNELRDGKPYDDQMVAPIGRYTSLNFHIWAGSLFGKVAQWFGKSVMAGFFWLPLVFAVIAVIPAFFIGWRKGGMMAGFAAATMIAVHPGFIGRTSAGFSDTDPYVVLFPLLAAFFLIESFETQRAQWTKRILFAGFAGLAFGLFSWAWGYWWFFFDVFVLALLAYGLYLFIHHLVTERTLKGFVRRDNFVIWGSALLLFIIFAGVFVTLFSSAQAFFTSPLNAVEQTGNLKAAVRAGNIWPNVFTTVAELNAPSITGIINNVGGKFLFVLAMMGVLSTLVPLKRMEWRDWTLLGVGLLIYLFLMSKGSGMSIISFLVIMSLPVAAGMLMLLWDRRGIDVKYAIFLSAWLVASVFTMTKGVRFVLLLLPPFAIAIGIALSAIYRSLLDRFEATARRAFIIAPLLFLIVSVPLVAPIQEGQRAAINEVPSMNDAWWNSLTKIREESAPDAIINSWWDFGHWFKYVADRAVTFDGASQNWPMAHWIGRALITENETEALGILRMLDCGSYQGVEDVRAGLDSDDYEAIKLTKEIILQPREDARATLEARGVGEEDITTILNHTHCDPPENYFITSGDMVGKGSVWGHFGLWDFRKADAYNQFRKASRGEAVPQMAEKYEITEETAGAWYDEMLGLSGRALNTWVSPWPGYATGWNGCQEQEGALVCPLGLNLGSQGTSSNRLEAALINTTSLNESFLVIGSYQGGARAGAGEALPAAFHFVNETDHVEVRRETSGNRLPLGVVVDLEQERILIADDANAMSLFSRLYYMDGRGTTAFEKFSDERSFTGTRIITWKVNWSMMPELGLER